MLPIMLRSLPPDERAEVLRRDRRSHRRGAALFRHGEPADRLHLVVTGRVGVRVATPEGQESIVAVIGPGRAVGIEAVLDVGPPGAGRTRLATVTALQAVEAVALHRSQVERLRAADPGLDRLLAEQLAEDLGRLSGHLLEMLFAPAAERVRRRLVALVTEFADPVVPLTQHDLALMTGSTRQTVNQVLREAERCGTVRLGRARIHVLDVDGLAVPDGPSMAR